MKTETSKPTVWWLVLLAAAGTFALTMGTRQTMGFFLSPLNTATGLVLIGEQRAAITVLRLLEHGGEHRMAGTVGLINARRNCLGVGYVAGNGV